MRSSPASNHFNALGGRVIGAGLRRLHDARFLPELDSAVGARLQECFEGGLGRPESVYGSKRLEDVVVLINDVDLAMVVESAHSGLLLAVEPHRSVKACSCSVRKGRRNAARPAMTET